jgi:hypothetical protein
VPNFVINAFAELPSKGVVEGFVTSKPFQIIVNFLKQFPEELSWRKKHKPSLNTQEGVVALANQFYKGYTQSHFPKLSKLIPDDVVSLIMEEAFDINFDQREKNKKLHSIAMSAENCLGQLLEKYIHSITHPTGWVWVAGDLIKAVDFILEEEEEGNWILLQIKNRSNSENSSSKAIRDGTPIDKWFRINANSGKTYWDKVPDSMQNLGLCEDGFRQFVISYIRKEKDHPEGEF